MKNFLSYVFPIQQFRGKGKLYFLYMLQQGDIVLTKLRKDDDLKVDIIYKFPKDAGLEALARAKQNNDCTLDDEVKSMSF